MSLDIKETEKERPNKLLSVFVVFVVFFNFFRRVKDALSDRNQKMAW